MTNLFISPTDYTTPADIQLTRAELIILHNRLLEAILRAEYVQQEINNDETSLREKVEMALTKKDR